MISQPNKFQAVDAQTFGSVMGQAVWLMTMSKVHRNLPIHTVESLISPAIFLRQFKLYSKGKQPVAFLIWASVSEEVKARLDTGGELDGLGDWRSGSNVIIVDCISPLAPRETFERKFIDSAKSAQHTDKN